MPHARAGERRVQRRQRAGAPQAIPSSIFCISSLDYRNPNQLPEGGVLVVGASASGVQLADEIRRSGRPVTLSVGEHVRLPRTYRGRDVLWWMENSGLWNQRYDEIDDLQRARGLPSPQLVGHAGARHARPERAERRRREAGRPAGRRARRPRAVLGRPAQSVRAGGPEDGADAGHVRPVGRDHARDAEVGPPERFAPTELPASSPLGLDLGSGEIRSIVWATGSHPDYSWLDVPVLDCKGSLRHEGGVVAAPGLYALGLPVLRRRKSTFIHGAEDDARD